MVDTYNVPLNSSQKIHVTNNGFVVHMEENSYASLNGNQILYHKLHLPPTPSLRGHLKITRKG